MTLYLHRSTSVMQDCWGLKSLMLYLGLRRAFRTIVIGKVNLILIILLCWNTLQLLFWILCIHIGAQLREWLLYYSLPVLHGMLSASLLDHYCFLVTGVHILLSDAITEDQLSCAEHCFNQFYSLYSTIYGMSALCVVTIVNFNNIIFLS